MSRRRTRRAATRCRADAVRNRSAPARQVLLTLRQSLIRGETMTADAVNLLEDALKLPQGERADVAACLFASLDDATVESLDPAWEAEIGRRLQEIDAGRAKLIPWEVARKRIFAHG